MRLATLDAPRRGVIPAEISADGARYRAVGDPGRPLAALLDGDLDALRGAVVACIGPQTAAAALEAGLPPHVVAGEPSVDALVGALRRYAAEVG